MRTNVVVGNWKMNKTDFEAVRMVQELWQMIKDLPLPEVVICPSFTSLRIVSKTIELMEMKIFVGAQDMHWEEKGAYTGEISPIMLKDQNAKYVILGHSERRKYFGQSNEMINKKIKAALNNDITPIFCVGETEEQREGGKTEEVVSLEVKKGLEGIETDKLEKVVVAYEPVWAIGTGKTATTEIAEETIKFIRSLLAEISSSEVAEKVKILYGGSVDSSNIKELMMQPDIDGVLVGGASLNADEFSKIIQY